MCSFRGCIALGGRGNQLSLCSRHTCVAILVSSDGNHARTLFERASHLTLSRFYSITCKNRWGTTEGFLDQVFHPFPVHHSPLGVDESQSCPLFDDVFLFRYLYTTDSPTPSPTTHKDPCGPLSASLTKSFHLSLSFVALWESANSSVVHSCCFPTSPSVFLLFSLLPLFLAVWSLRGQTSVARVRFYLAFLHFTSV